MSEVTSTAPTNNAAAAPSAPTAPVVTAPAPAPGATMNIGDDTAAPPAALAPAEAAGTIIEYNKTGDAGLDMALSFVGKLGITPDHPAMVAAAKGDHSLLKAHLASLGDKAKGWEQYVALAEKSHGDGKAAADAKAAATEKMVHDTVGGAEAWADIAAWAKENAEPDERVAVNAALKAGGMQAQAMAAYLKSLHEGAAGTTITPAPAVVPSAKPAVSNGNGALTSAQYVTEVANLRAKMGFDFEGSQAYTDLQNRRMAGQRRGI